MDCLFKKAVSLTDLHFGRKANSPQANQDNISFLEWFIEEARTWGAETCIMMGDFHDNRNSLQVNTMNYSLRAMQMLNDAFKNVYWITGNHDLYFRENRSLNSVEYARLFPNITITRNPMTVEDVTFLPWLVGDERKKIKDIKSRYVFGHLEIAGFMLNGKIEMPETEHGLNGKEFVNQEFVFTGHFHKRQERKKSGSGHIVYTGNIFPFDFSDAGEDDRGMMFLEWGKEPFFKAWADQPLFRNMLLSDLLMKPKQLLKPKLTARVTIDVDISYEEAQVIKETFISDYDLRKIELTPQSRSLHTEEFNDEAVIFQSVDQIVIDGLMSVSSTGGMSAETLVEIYRDLPNL